METILLDILGVLRKTGRLDDELLAKIIRRHNKDLGDGRRHYAKKQLMPYYLGVKRGNPRLWASWNIDRAAEKQLLEVLRVKPRRTASGVATITVLTKPWKCSSNCLYCPSDLRMPKSYLSDEPACQRAETHHFDPYLQVASRLYVLVQMGHVTDKVELIVLGGTWSDYPADYQVWFVTEMFRALNEAEGSGADGDSADGNGSQRRQSGRHRDGSLAPLSHPLPHPAMPHPHLLTHLLSHQHPLSHRRPPDAAIAALQQEVNSGTLSYNQAIEQLYDYHSDKRDDATEQTPDFDELIRQHDINEYAQHRAVGLTIETRPDAITCESLALLRQLGCTKVQMGVQSLNPAILRMNNRTISLDKIAESFGLLRLFGFKIHVHFMLNLYGATCDGDIRDYERLVTEAPYVPDEVKLYPCALVCGTGLCEQYAKGTWQPYSEEELLTVLIADTLTTPPFIRISRMVRDISAHDIVAGNKKANLRQLVEQRIAEADGGASGDGGAGVSVGTSGDADESGGADAGTVARITEIRYREIATSETYIECLTLETLAYETTVTDEYFLQWVTPEYKIAGFLRLSLPKIDYVRRHQPPLPVCPHEAMIREVHVYGKVAALHERAAGTGAQHLGLGRQLIDAACTLAKARGYQKINVISSIGTRQYYRALGFYDNGLYQQRLL